MRHSLNDLLRHAKALSSPAELRTEVDAIETQRSLLAEPDPVRPLLDKVVGLLRQALNAKLGAFTLAFEQQQAQLNGDADWKKLNDGQRADLTAGHQLSLPPEVALATPEQLQDALDGCDLGHWASRTQALSSRFDAARHAAVQWLKPNVTQVAIPRRTINDEAELKAWLAEVEALVGAKLKSGPVAL